jgi:hypothetical protein
MMDEMEKYGRKRSRPNLKYRHSPIYAISVLHFKKVNKGKAIPLKTWTGPEGSRRLKLPYFKKIGK